MGKGINFASKEFELKLLEDINTSGLPPVIVKLILLNIIKEVEIAENSAIQSEQKAFISDKNKEKNNKEGEKN